MVARVVLPTPVQPEMTCKGRETPHATDTHKQAHSLGQSTYAGDPPTQTRQALCNILPRTPVRKSFVVFPTILISSTSVPVIKLKERLLGRAEVKAMDAFPNN